MLTRYCRLDRRLRPSLLGVLTAAALAAAQFAPAGTFDPCLDLTFDCNNNGQADDCDIADGLSQDCNFNGVPDECDIVNGTSRDCNFNGVPDECDIANGTSEDCNGNLFPDECDIAFKSLPGLKTPVGAGDCNSNGVPDDCDIADGTSFDCNFNFVPDECELDSDFDGTIDDCDTCAFDPFDDIDADGICGDIDPCPEEPGLPTGDICAAPGCPVPDRDFDGVPDCIDACPDEPGLPTGGTCAGPGCPVPDSDFDGVPDCIDSCPDEPGPPFPNACGQMGCPDPDRDFDGVPDCADPCPDEPGSPTGGICSPPGCPDSDRDFDGVPDCFDPCPDEPGSPTGGICSPPGCPDPDRDFDGVPDCLDSCPDDAGSPAGGVCSAPGCPDPDSDSDGVPDCADPCPDNAGSPTGGVCSAPGCPDPDRDNDSTPDCVDGCPDNPDKIDAGVCGCEVPEGTCSGGAFTLAVGVDAGGLPHYRTFDAADAPPVLVSDFLAYPAAFTGGVRVAVGDVDGDSIPDMVAGGGGGSGGSVFAFSGADGSTLRSFLAFGSGFSGGVFVAAGDIDGDGHADMCVGADAGSPPHVKMFSGLTGAELSSFFAYDPAFTGGVRVAVGDVNGDGLADIVTGAGPGAGPHVKVFDGATGGTLQSFFAYDPGFPGGVHVASGDLDGDGAADIVTGAGAGGAPHVKVFDGATGSERSSFLAYPVDFTGGVTVAAGDVDGDGRCDIVTGAGPSAGPHVKVFDGVSLAETRNFFAFDPGFSGGVFVGAPSLTNDCNLNGVEDPTDIARGTSQDCNSNNVPDECDIAGGTSEDCNSNLVPDECDVAGIACIAPTPDELFCGLRTSSADPLRIIEGLPPDTEVQVDSFFDIFYEVVDPAPSGGLGGTAARGSGDLECVLKGLGLLSAYSRSLVIPLTPGTGNGFEVHRAPFVPGAPVQTFDTDMFRLFGQLPPGDPDFDLLRITAGTNFGLPSPGHTTLTRLPSGDWQVDSFFDITYRIDFIGTPGGPLAGRSGSTTGTIRIEAGTPAFSEDCDMDGVPDECEPDSDMDGTIDDCDACPDDIFKTEPGACGCGEPDTDSDRDGTLDCNDGCPDDPDKTDPGACGCGVPEDCGILCPPGGGPVDTADGRLADDAGGSNRDSFGASVAVCGDTAIVGAPHADPLGLLSAGRAYIAEYDGVSTWTLTTMLTAPAPTAADSFGASVAISGDVAVVGEPFDDTNGLNAGAVHVFRRGAASKGVSSWIHEATLFGSDAGTSDRFGSSVAIDGDRIVAGAPYDVPRPRVGAVYVFEYAAGSWSETAKLTPSDGYSGDAFGTSVSVSADLVAVGSPGDDDLGSNSGSLYLYTWTGAAWVEEKATAVDGGGGDSLGASVDATGTTVAAGATGDDDGATNSGAVYLFESLGATTAVQTTKIKALAPGLAASMGASVAIGGATSPGKGLDVEWFVAAGAPLDDEAGSDAGAAHLFLVSGASSIQIAKYFGAVPDSVDYNGTSVDLTGATLLSGAEWGNRINSTSVEPGSAYFFVPAP